MRNRKRSLPSSAFLIALICCLLIIPLSQACTRVVYLGPDGNVITARSMDWKVDVGTNLWILPRGMARTGEAGPNSVHWTSKYGSVIATGYDISTTDGMNEQGLVANVLWLVESKYPQPASTKPMLAISIWAQYVLDNFATVAEAVDVLQKEPFTVVTANVPGEDRLATLHPLYVRRHRRQRHHRIHRRQAGHPPRPQVSGHDQLAHLRQTARPRRVLEKHRRNGHAARHESRRRPASRAPPSTSTQSPKTRPRTSPWPASSASSGTPPSPTASQPPTSPISLPHAGEPSPTRREKIYFFESAVTPNTFWIDFQDRRFLQRVRKKVMKLDLGSQSKPRLRRKRDKRFQGNQTLPIPRPLTTPVTPVLFPPAPKHRHLD